MTVVSDRPLTKLDKLADTDHPIHELLHSRWSPRAFADRPVEMEKLANLLEAARWSASSRNEQPWRFIVATRENPTALERIFNVLNERNQKWARTAPVLLLGVAKRAFDHSGQANAYAWYDVGQAMAHLSVQASAEGLYVHQMGGFQKDLARERFGIPEDYEPVVAVAIGYLGALDQLPADLHERELAVRQRKPLRELVFAGDWNQPFIA